MGDLPHGTVTFLFTDVEGSTQLLRQLGKRYADALEEHLELLRAATAEHGGREIDTQGDSYFAAFACVSDAVGAAVEAQRALGAHAWPDGSKLCVRMGVHTGEAAARSDRFVGLGVHRAARICAVGHGGQVLVSEAAHQALRGEPRDGVTFKDLGRCRLKDFRQSQHLFQVLAPGLRRDFPHIATVAPTRRRRRAMLVAAAVGSAACAAAVVALLVRSAAAPARVAANHVAVIDPRDARLLSTAAVGVLPGPIVQAAGSVWVANLNDSTITRIDATTRQPVATITPGGFISGLGAGVDSVWVSDTTTGAVKRVDPAVNAVTGNTPPTGASTGDQSFDEPQPVAVGAGSLWVAQGGAVTRFTAAGTRRLASIPVGDQITAIAVGAGATWVTDATKNIVARIVDDKVIKRISTGDGPDAIAVGDGAVWVAQRFDGTIARIDPRGDRITDLIRVGAAPSGVAVIGGSVWVANSGDGTLSRIDARGHRVAQTMTVGSSPVALADVGGTLWVSVRAPNTSFASPAGAPSGGVARVALTAPPDSLDPALAYEQSSWRILYATCAKLYNFPDASGAAGARAVPEVARGQPSVSADGRTYTITVRTGFRFSSGAAVTAQTFRHVIERDASPRWRPGESAIPPSYFTDIVGGAAYMHGTAAHISGISASVDRLVIRLTHPDPTLELRLTLPIFCAVPDDAPVRHGGIANLPMAGPYYVRSYTPEQQIVLARNPYYRGHRPARLKAIDITIGGTSKTAIARVIAGKQDYYSPDSLEAAEMSAGQAAGLQARFGYARARPGPRVFVNPSGGVSYFMLNTARPLFSRARLRRAVNLAIDRQALTEPTGFPSQPTDQYLAPGMPGFRDRSLYPLTPDLARARRLADHAHRRATLVVCDKAPCPHWAAVIRADLARIGIDVTAVELPIHLMYARDQDHTNWDIGYFGWFPDYPDPANVLNMLLTGRNPPDDLNVSRFDDPSYERRLNSAARLTGLARYATYARLDADLTAKAAPMIAFAMPLKTDLLSARMGCEIYQPVYQGIDLGALCIRH